MTEQPSDSAAADGAARRTGPQDPQKPGDTGSARAAGLPIVRRLDPVTALRTDGESRLSPTYYLADQLLIDAPAADGPGWDDALVPLNKALFSLHVQAQFTPGSRERLPRRQSGDLPPMPSHAVAAGIQLAPTDIPAALPDAWAVLQQLRQSDPAIAASLSLNHVIHPAVYWPGIRKPGPRPHWASDGEPGPDLAGAATGEPGPDVYWPGIGGYGPDVYWPGIGEPGPDVYWPGIGGYGRPGFGARMPVSVVLRDPGLRARVDGRHPVIAMLDTPVAEHPWFPLLPPGTPSAPGRLLRYVVDKTGLAQEGTAGSPAPPSAIGEINPRTGARQRLEGHGTFIAGLLRQGCPEACILAVPVMSNEGYAEEGEVLHALTLLYDLHCAGQDGDPDGMVIDVLSLSMGYYAEDDNFLGGRVDQALSALRATGVLVVAGVGNDASIIPFVPAALAGEVTQPLTTDSEPPVLSVSANNPDGRTVALFANEVKYVSAYRPGVAVVSTMPLLDGAGQASASVPSTARVRGTMDPDNFQSGFGVWSGTSFAAPIFAAELAAALIAADALTDVTPPVMRKRALKAIAACGEPK